MLLCSGLAVACGSDAFDNAIWHNLKELRTYMYIFTLRFLPFGSCGASPKCWCGCSFWDERFPTMSYSVVGTWKKLHGSHGPLGERRALQPCFVSEGGALTLI